ncbi:MAG TPA: arsinothricin resistance N-acetyltransferase ArsN1 family A [Candidatus Limnocylindria bacterium]
MPDLVRAAGAADATDIARIYNEGIAERSATFETKQRTAEDMAKVLAERAARYPLIVVERDGRVIAWAGASEYRPRECYAGIAEFSVYVDRQARGTGAGTAAMRGLIEACAAKGFWKLVSRVFPENTASRRLLASLGFREVGVYERHGKLDGEWKDVVIVEKRIGDAA